MSTKPKFHSMTWYDDGVNGLVMNPRNSVSNAPQAYEQPRTIAPQELFRESPRYQNGYDRSSRPGSNSSSDSGSNYVYSRPSTTARSAGIIRTDSILSFPRGETNSSGIVVEDRTQIQAPRSKRYYCDYEDCIDDNGNRRSVSRKADMKRHMVSVHGPAHIDCKYNKCERKGDNGFRRMDHYREHRRGYHNEQSENGS